MQRPTGIIRLTGEIIAQDVAYEDFLTQFHDQRVEWINGVVVTMSPVSSIHNSISVFLIMLFEAYLDLTGGGHVFHDPMVMRPTSDSPARAPDIQLILTQNEDIIRDNEIAGPADLVVEIVSPESQRRDRIEKFSEYERGGVREYWIIDPIRQEILTYHLNDDGVYTLTDTTNIIHSHVLAQFSLQTDILWREQLPRFGEIAKLVEAMLKGKG